MAEQLTSPLAIDQNKLDEEWLDQAEQFHNAAVQLALAKFRRDERKAALEVVRADVTLDVYSNPTTRYRLPKLTEKTAEAAVARDKRVRVATKAYNQAKYKVEMLEALVNGFEQRKTALENLVKLEARDYFAEPRVRVAQNSSEDRKVKRRLETKKEKKLYLKGRMEE
jgi:hypothetical protein